MSQQGPEEGDSAQISGGVIASITGAGLLAIFMVQNTEQITLHFLFWHFTWPLWLFTLTTALFGALLWFGLGVLRRHRRRKASRASR